jgi:hypothetical protein
MSADLRLIVSEGQQVAPMDDQLMASSFIALGESILSGKISIEQAIVVAVVDGAITYTPFGRVTLAEGIGILELASRKIERDMLDRAG